MLALWGWVQGKKKKKQQRRRADLSTTQVISALFWREATLEVPIIVAQQKHWEVLFVAPDPDQQPQGSRSCVLEYSLERLSLEFQTPHFSGLLLWIRKGGFGGGKEFGIEPTSSLSEYG